MQRYESRRCICRAAMVLLLFLFVISNLWAQDQTTSTLQSMDVLAGDGSVTGVPARMIDVPTVSPDALLDFARRQIGTPYRYASADPRHGFDCSGFVNYVFGHFGIALPRSSKDFALLGPRVALSDAQAGDVLLFSGTDGDREYIGHLGIVEMHAGDVLAFLHSSSGQARGVVRTHMSPYYQARFIGAIRVF